MALTSSTKLANNCLVLIFALLVANLVTPDVFRQAAAQDSFAITPPPVAQVRPVADDYFGTMVADPYRYKLQNHAGFRLDDHSITI